MSTFAPRTAEEVTEAIRWALAAGEAFEVLGGGSRRALGRPVDAPHVLDVSGLSGIVSYEPAELVLTARAGTPMAVIGAALEEHSQCFAFEPPDLAALLSNGARATTGVSGTLGGVVATGLAGSRRFRAGSARDHVLGIAAVSGRGEAFVGGGKVVKNVTGYDMPKLMAGSYGTLAALTEITMKVLPAPECVRTIVVAGLSARDAVRAMTSALQTSLEVSGACYLPVSVAAGEPVTAFRLEGFVRSVEARLGSLRSLLESTVAGSLSVLEDEASAAFWRDVRDVRPFAWGESDLVWRVSVPPVEGAAVAERIERVVPGAKWFLDWGGGLIWAAVRSSASNVGGATGASGASSSDATGLVARVREAIGATGGHATLMRAPAELRSRVDVFHPPAAAVAALSKRVKAQFDPSRVLNPGRMYAGV